MENSNPVAAAPASNQYVINNVQQLFPVNNNLVNFHAKFYVKSLSNEPFQGLVVNQQLLDSGDSLQFRQAEQGVFSGEIKQDNDVAENWYLALKSVKPNKVSIQVQTVQIPAAPQPEPQQQIQQLARAGGRDSGSTVNTGKGWGSFFTVPNLLKVLLGVGVVSALVVFAKRYLKKRSSYVSNDKPNPYYSSSNLNDDYAELMPAVAQLDEYAPSSPLVGGGGLTELPASPSPPVVTGGSTPPAASEGHTSAAILGEDLLAKVNNLPAI